MAAKILTNVKLGIRLTIHGNRVRIQSTKPRLELFEQDAASRVWIEDTLQRQRLRAGRRP